MRMLIKILAAMLLIFAVITIHLGISYIFPFPWNKVNIIFAAIVLSLLLFESGVSVWTTCIIHFFVEVYAPQPFGIIIFSSTLSILFVFWLYQHLFTNKSWYSAMVMTAVALILYRVLYSVLLGIIFFVEGRDIPFARLFALYGWELFLTTIFTGCLYLLLKLISKPIRKEQQRKIVWTSH